MNKDERGENLTNRRVLVVEDEYFLADDVAQALRQLGADVVGPVATADRAMALIQAGEVVDVALLDINLRGEMAYPVVDALIERGIPVVFATGYDSSSVPEAYRDLPRWEKPFRAEDFARALPDLLRRSAAH